MTPKELRNERLAERMIKNLKRRNMEAFYCPTAAEAVKKVSEQTGQHSRCWIATR